MSNRHPDLLPCPFCGGAAKLQEQPACRPEIGHNWWTINCLNETIDAFEEGHGCPVNPLATGDDRDETIDAWNTRADVHPDIASVATVLRRLTYTAEQSRKVAAEHRDRHLEADFLTLANELRNLSMYLESTPRAPGRDGSPRSPSNGSPVALASGRSSLRHPTSPGHGDRVVEASAIHPEGGAA